MVKAESLLVLILALSVSATLADTSTGAIKARDVAEALRQDGIPFTSAVTEQQATAGALSAATTATAEAGVDVIVFDSNEVRYQAHLAQLKTCPDCTYAVECGPILVTFAPKRMPNDTVSAQSQAVYQILKARYACE